MKTTHKAILIACGLTLAVSTSTTIAQVAPPPTEPAKKQPAYTPPAKPTPTPAAKPAAKPQPKQGMTGGKRGTGDVSSLPTEVPYPKLAQPGTDGRIVRLRQLPDIAAMKSNPNIGPKSVEKIMPVVYARRYRIEIMVTDNLDLYWGLTDGLIENMNMADINQMGRIAGMLKPLVPETTLSQQLLNMGILTRVQGGMNQFIVREYKKAITDEIQVLDAENGLEEVMRFVLDDSIHESRIAYKGMLAESITQIGSLVEAAGITSDAAQTLVTFEKTLSSDPQQQLADLEEYDKAFRKLSLDDAISILETMRSLRKFPEISPTVGKINVLHSRKKVMEGNGFQVEVKDKDGKVLKKAGETNNPADEIPEPSND